MNTAPPHAPPLPLSKVAILIGLGALLWFLGVLFLRWAGSVGALTGIWHLVIYAAIVPFTLPLIQLAPMIAGLARAHTLRAIAILSMTALIIDGVVIGYFPHVYSSDPAIARACAGGLLWAVGVALVLALSVGDGPAENAP